jgi:hypothetical protein
VSQAVFDTVEAVSVLLFTLDFTARLITASKQKAYRSAYAYMTSFFGVVDFVSIAPWYIQVSDTILKYTIIVIVFCLQSLLYTV